MNTKQKKRLFAIIIILLLVATGLGLILYALKQNINLFYTPTQLLEANIHDNQPIRVGGFVKKHSVHYWANGASVSFVITDNNNQLTVQYQGVLPNLFREGQGVVVTGKLTANHRLHADQVLAKHDEKYTPPMLNKALNNQKASKHDS